MQEQDFVDQREFYLKSWANKIYWIKKVADLH